MGNIKDKQIGALGLCAVSVISVLFLPQLGWTAVLPVATGALLIVTFGKSVRNVEPTASVKILSVPLFLWNVVMLSRVGWELSAVQRVDSLLPGLLLLLLGAYGIKKKVLPVVGAVLIFFVIGIYGVICIFAFPNVELANLYPDHREDLTGIAYGFLPVLLLYMYKSKGRKLKLAWGLGGVVLALAAAVITEGMNAPNFYTASMSVNLLGAMERLEPFVASAMTAGGFCLIGMLFRVNEIIWNELWEYKKNFPIEIILLLSALGMFLFTRIGVKMLDLGTTVCWGLVPIITQLVAYRKKDEKNQKNFKKMLDKWEDIC